VKSGLQDGGPEFMHAITDLELGGSEQLGVGLARQQTGDAQCFFLDLLADDGGNALGLGFLFRAEVRFRHDASPDDAEGRNFGT
jgi:hypothetical protein